MEDVQERSLIRFLSHDEENRLPELRQSHEQEKPKSDSDFQFYVFTKKLKSFTFPQMIQSESNHLRSDDVDGTHDDLANIVELNHFGDVEGITVFHELGPREKHYPQVSRKNAEQNERHQCMEVFIVLVN